ncbi:MAG TPA: hypothetical protein VF288_10620 [Mycobacteriales bacterium]
MSESVYERALERQFRALGLPDPVREHRFHPARRFRFDFAWPDRMIAIEVDGGSWAAGRHTTGVGFERDCTKSCLAAIAGWRVLHVTGTMVMDGTAVGFAEAALAP